MSKCYLLSLATGRRSRIPGLALLAVFALLLGGCRIGTGGGTTPAAPSDGPATGSACFSPPAIPFTPAEGDETGDWQSVPAPAVDEACFRLSAEKADAAGVATDSSFVLQTRDALKPDEVAQLVAVSPAVELDVAAAEPPMAASDATEAGDATGGTTVSADLPNAYRLTPKTPLAAGELYRFAVLSTPQGQPVQTFSFQAQRPLAVVQTLPQSQITGVPLDTGIELTFSHDGVTGIEDHVTIDPPVEGTWQQHKRTFAFVPEALAPDTLYTVTVEPGVGVTGSDEALAEPFVLQFETGSDSRGGDEMPTVLGFARSLWESSTAEAPVLAMYTVSSSGPLDPGPLPFTVYRYEGPEPFAAALGEATAIPYWANQARRSYAADTAGLAEVTSFEAQPRPVGETGDLLVSLPTPLEPGYYLVTTTFEDQPVQTWLQVTDLAAYVAVSAPTTLVWVNDVAAKTPVQGATVKDLGGSSFGATTGADGTTLVDTPAEMIGHDTTGNPYSRPQTVGTLLVSDDAGRTAVIPLTNVLANNTGSPFRTFGFAPGTDFWRYLYVDRHLYRPTDTVRFWGLVRPRYQSAGPLDLTVELVDNGTQDYYYQPAVAARTNVTTRPDGTFIGELPLVGAAPGYYEVRVKHGEDIVTSTYAEVRNFVKPAYKIDVLPEKASVYVGEPIRATVQTAFFEGSPVPGVGLTYQTWVSEPLSGTVTTDANGLGTISLDEVTLSQGVAYQPFEILTLSLTPTSPEEGDISGAGNVRVFRSSLDVTATGMAADGLASVTGTVYAVDPDRTEDVYSGDPATWRADPVGGQTVTAEIVETTYEQVPQGQSYDYVTKTVVPRYYYEERNRTLDTRQVVTAQDGTFTLGFPVDDDKSYSVRLTVTDDRRARLHHPDRRDRHVPLLRARPARHAGRPPGQPLRRGRGRGSDDPARRRGVARG